MPSYLESLTVRLATGLARMPEDYRSRHAGFLRAKQNADGGFSGREGGSDLYYTSFALRGLAVLGALDGDVAHRAAGFCRGRLEGQESIIDFLCLMYSVMLLDLSAGIDVAADTPGDWRQRVADAMERFRRPDGGYAKSHEGASSSTYYTFLVLLCRELMGAPPVEPERLIEFVHSRQRDDGGFVEIGPMKRSGTNPTAAAVGTLKILDAVDEALRLDVTEYLAEQQQPEGGLAANTRIGMADVLSTFTGLLTLADLGSLSTIDLAAADRFVRSLESPSGGYQALSLDPVIDVEYTFYGLGATALLANARAGET